MENKITSAEQQTKTWWVYIIEASDGRYYTGITIDLERRWKQHRDGKSGAKFFRGRQPVNLLYTESSLDRSSASKREAAIKKLSRKQKERLIAASVTDTGLADEVVSVVGV